MSDWKWFIDQFRETEHARNERLICAIKRRIEAKRNSPYGEMCRNPDVCAGKGYCPLDPTCGD